MKIALAALTSIALISLASSPALASESKMMTQKDVPASFGTPTSFDFDTKIIGKVIGICDNASGQTLVSVPAPKKQFLVDIETKNKKTYTEVFERVYQFSTAKKAEEAFTSLFNQLSTCNGTTSMTQDGPGLEQTVTTGSYPGGEYADFWVNVAGTWSGDDLQKPTRTVVNAVYVQAGDAIVETVAYINGRAALTPKQRNQLADLAMDLGARWAK